jgi:ATP-dependent Clp protease ATP-binding subunit ClpX
MTQNPPFPSPEELKAKLSEFMKTNFGDKVAFTTYTEPETAEAPTEEKPRAVSDEQFVFNFLPRDIKAHLDRFVIKQDEAKKVLSIAVCDHYNHVNYLRRLEKEDAARAEETEYAKQNVILVGPTGVGKTYLIKHIAELIKVPFVKADATKFSEVTWAAMSRTWCANWWTRLTATWSWRSSGLFTSTKSTSWRRRRTWRAGT